jgi:hypothetical protein
MSPHLMWVAIGLYWAAASVMRDPRSAESVMWLLVAIYAGANHYWQKAERKG